MVGSRFGGTGPVRSKPLGILRWRFYRFISLMHCSQPLVPRCRLRLGVLGIAALLDPLVNVCHHGAVVTFCMGVHVWVGVWGVECVTSA